MAFFFFNVNIVQECELHIKEMRLPISINLITCALSNKIYPFLVIIWLDSSHWHRKRLWSAITRAKRYLYSHNIIGEIESLPVGIGEQKIIRNINYKDIRSRP